VRLAVLGWLDSVERAYLGDLSSLAWAAATDSCCAAGATEAEIKAGSEFVHRFYLRPALRLIRDHLRYLETHPPAACYRDGFREDLDLTKAYEAWLQNWFPGGGWDGPAGAAQIRRLEELEARVNVFLEALTAYLAPCPR
jgi:hypothetical protein